jgi:hypothetical protein
MIPDSELPGWLQESRKTTREAAKSLVAYDEWRKNPARAAGAVAFNGLTFMSGAAAAGKAGTVAKVVNIAGKTGRVIDPITYVVKGAGKAYTVVLPKVRDLVTKLTESRAGARAGLPRGVELQPGDVLSPDGKTKIDQDGALRDLDGNLLKPGFGERSQPPESVSTVRQEQPILVHAGHDGEGGGRRPVGDPPGQSARPETESISRSLDPRSQGPTRGSGPTGPPPGSGRPHHPSGSGGMHHGGAQQPPQAVGPHGRQAGAGPGPTQAKDPQKNNTRASSALTCEVKS